jgi:hypothetical protein
MGRACSTHGWGEMYVEFWLDGQYGDIDLGGRIILRWILERGRMEWYGLD